MRSLSASGMPRATMNEVIEINNEPSKYAPGRLKCILFDKHGVRRKVVVMDSDNLVEAIEWAQENCLEGGSFAIDRTIHNSLNGSPWDAER